MHVGRPVTEPFLRVDVDFVEGNNRPAGGLMQHKASCELAWKRVYFVYFGSIFSYIVVFKEHLDLCWVKDNGAA